MADNKIIKKIVLSDGTAADLDVKYWGGLETSAKQDTLISGTNIKTINGLSIIGEGNIDTVKGIVEVTYLNLMNDIARKKLKPGQQYRIKDYTTTTTQENTISAGYQFDIIVTANSNNTLSEIAKACLHGGRDDYFADCGCDIDSWRIWYCVYNDTSRFGWADMTSKGKGVIYRMIDEWGNDCPYDFKNIQFKRWLYADGAGVADEESGDFYSYCYTFSWEEDQNVIMDASIFGNNGSLLNEERQINGVYGNIIGVYNSYDGDDESPQSTKQYLNDIVFFSTYDYESGNYYGCYSNTFGNNCYSNTFGNNCCSNTFGNSCYANTFGNSCYANTFGYECNSNTFGDNCYSNIFGNDCRSNTFDYECDSNTFGNSCYENTFVNNCSNNTFGNGCRSNKFLGSGCSENTFDNNCYENECGYGFCRNTFDKYCYSNKFGNICQSNNFGNSCYGNELPSYCLYNTFDTSCSKNTVINEAGTTQKYNIKKGVSEKTIIVDSTFINLEIGVDVWVTSSGELIQEPINEYISLEDIDLMWSDVFSLEGYYSSTGVVEEGYENINSIGIGDYDEEKEGSDEE